MYRATWPGHATRSPGSSRDTGTALPMACCDPENRGIAYPARANAHTISPEQSNPAGEAPAHT